MQNASLLQSRNAPSTMSFSPTSAIERGHNSSGYHGAARLAREPYALSDDPCRISQVNHGNFHLGSTQSSAPWTSQRHANEAEQQNASLKRAVRELQKAYTCLHADNEAQRKSTDEANGAIDHLHGTVRGLLADKEKLIANNRFLMHTMREQSADMRQAHEDLRKATGALKLVRSQNAAWVESIKLEGVMASRARGRACGQGPWSRGRKDAGDEGRDNGDDIYDDEDGVEHGHFVSFHGRD